MLLLCMQQLVQNLGTALIFDAHKQLHLRELLYDCGDRSLGAWLGVGVVSSPVILRGLIGLNRLEGAWVEVCVLVAM